MKIHEDCFPCLLRQTLRITRLMACSSEKQAHVLQAVSAFLATADPSESPPAIAGGMYAKIAGLTGCKDPYHQIKKSCNQQARQVVDGLRQEIHDAAGELLLAVRFAIAGNIIDYGAFDTFDVAAALENGRSAPLAVDNFARLSAALDTMAKGSTILYLADNCGEIVYDSLLLDYLHRRGFDITIAVKEGPIINDALVEDALEAGLDRYGRIITNGCRCPGTVLELCSQEFLRHFTTADLVIAKGQGNFESLSDTDRNIFFLLTIKCMVAARHMARLAGVEPGRLPGKGEMAVYYSEKI